MFSKEALRAHHEPPPLYTSHVCGAIEHKVFGRLTIRYGLTRELVEQLKQRSLDITDEVLQKQTSDFERFGIGSYEEWYTKGRHPFALVSEKQELAALVWFGPSTPPPGIDVSAHRPDQWDTIAFRSYIPFRGVGIMRDFSQMVVTAHEVLFPQRPLWLQTKLTNTAGYSLYSALGFVACSSNTESVVMTRVCST